MAILAPRTYEQELHGFRGGRFSSDRTKFFAYTYACLDSVEYDDYQAIFLDFGCHSSIGADSERQQKWIDAHSYQMKDMEECIKDRIYLAWSLQFTGMLYEGDWFVQKSLTFWGEQIDEGKSIALLTRGLDDPVFWTKGPFGPTEVIARLDNRSYRNVEEEEFLGVPSLVSQLKIEEKRKLNGAFQRYMNILYVHPFLQQMRIRFPDEYVDFSSLFGDYTLLHSKDRSCFLVVTMAKHSLKGYRLVWFFYEPPSSKFYRWTYPKPRYSKWVYAYGEDVIEDLKDICEWNDFGFLTSSRTLDDPRFWSEYVLKSENGRYRWIEEIA
jgi:hypothetical protein